MREILFRGKRLNNGEWIEGHLISCEDGRERIVGRKIEIFYYEKDDSIIQTVAHRVDPETVYQYTGLTDKEGNKIWEHDVCQYIETTTKGTVIVSETFIVKYGRHREATGTNLGFYIEWLEEDNYRTDICFWAENREIEVIGNIFDDPELMKGEIDVHM